MALDTNIALGVKPVEQPNMLAQMGQMMQIRQMQQGYESENALRDFYAQGGDLSTAEGKRQLMSRAPGAGMKLIGQQSEISARDINTAEKSLAMLKDQAGLVRTPEDAANWLSSFYKNPLTRPYVEAIAPIDKALAAIPTDPAALQGWLRNASLKAKDIFESADAQLGARSRIQAAGIGAAPGMLNAQLAREKFTLEQKQQAEIDALFGKPPSAAPAAAPMTGGGGGVPNALPAVVGASPAAPAPTNMLVPSAQAPATAGVPAAAPVAAPTTAAPIGDPYDQIKAIDAKIAPLVNSGNPRATAIVQQLIAQRNALMQSAKQMYSGQETTMATTDPKTGLTIVVKARPNEYGVLFPIEMAPVPLSTDASGTGSTGISPTVARPAPSAPVWNEKTNTWMTPPTPENPKGTAVENPEVRNIVQTRAANATLKVAGYDPKTGTDEVSSLIKKSTSGLGENWANKAWSAITGTGSEGAEAIAKLETRANEMTLALAPNGSLGAGFSNEDRNFMLGKLGDVANPNKPMNVRLAAWEDVMERTARNAGVPYTKQSYGESSSSKPAAPSTTLPKGFKLD